MNIKEKSKMIIGVDIDGVVADRLAWRFTFTKDYFAKRGIELVDRTVYYVEDAFNISREQGHEYWKNSSTDYARYVAPISGAKETLDRLKKDGHTIIINTARWYSERNDEVGEHMRNAVKEWLVKHEIPYDELVFSSFGNKDKLEVVNKYNIDIHIDDYEREIYLIAPHKPVIIFEQPYNKNLTDIPNTHRAHNWDDVYSIISRLSSTV